MSFDNGQFFKPTGFENRFEADPVVPLENLRTSHKKDVEEAVRHVNGQADKVSALSMSLEPGSGKTTVLPFRFPTSSVCVVLPTGFDAFCAFRLASGPANINTGKYTEDNKANVTYMDSYTAGFMCFKHKGSLPFQIIIIDESDSNAGITKTLTEVKFRDSYVIHLSGTPEGREMLSTSGFEIEMYGTLPELSETYFDAVDFIKTRADGKRGMVMVPNSKVARQIHNMLKNSKIIDTDTTVDELDALVKQQSGNDLIVADDSCVRGFNLNLDIVFDFQRTGAGESERNITRHEHQQRRMRVGRLKPGVYYFTPVEYSSTSFTQWDVFRNNVAREVFGLPLKECSLSVDKSRLGELMVSRVEPYDLQLTLPDLVDVSKEPTPAKERPRRRSSALSDEAPAWVLWASGYKGKLSKKHSRGTSGSSTGSKAIASSSASSSAGSSVKPSHSVSVVGSPTSKPTSITTAHGSATVSAKATGRELVGAVGGWTPTIDLSTGSCEDWPDALRAAYLKGDKLCMVKPGAWVYTSREDAVDHKKTLLDIEIKGPTFTKPEMETVCRAWNVLVSRMNFGFAQGKDAWGDSQHVGFVLDYFSAYNDMMFN